MSEVDLPEVRKYIQEGFPTTSNEEINRFAISMSEKPRIEGYSDAVVSSETYPKEED